MKKLLLIPAIFSSLFNDLEKKLPRTHPWASFTPGSWVKIYSHHRMIRKKQDKPIVWESESKITVMKVEGDRMVLRHNHLSTGVQEEAILPVPGVDILPGTRSLGQWPHDIFPLGPERQSGITPEHKNPFPENITLKVLEENIEISVKDKKYKTILFLKEWNFPAKDGKNHWAMKAWVAKNVELPLKWVIYTSDGTVDSETELVKIQDTIKIGEKEFSCLVTVTKKKLPNGLLVKKRWSSSEVPGFMVKMESTMEDEDFILNIKERVTDFFIKK